MEPSCSPSVRRTPTWTRKTRARPVPSTLVSTARTTTTRLRRSLCSPTTGAGTGPSRKQSNASMWALAPSMKRLASTRVTTCASAAMSGSTRKAQTTSVRTDTLAPSAACVSMATTVTAIGSVPSATRTSATGSCSWLSWLVRSLSASLSTSS
eukprot:Rmarinus@m.24281